MIFIDMFTQNLHINISICPTPTQHFYLSNYKNQPLACSLKHRKSEGLDLRPSPRKSLMFQAFSHYQLCTLVNRSTLSTCIEILHRINIRARGDVIIFFSPFNANTKKLHHSGGQVYNLSNVIFKNSLKIVYNLFQSTSIS